VDRVLAETLASVKGFEAPFRLGREPDRLAGFDGQHIAFFTTMVPLMIA